MRDSRKRQRLSSAIVALGLIVAADVTTVRADTAAERLTESAAVLKEIMDAPDQGIPEDLLKTRTASS